MQKRFWEIDTLRGLAVLGMVLFNYAFALRYLGVYALGGGDLFWFYFPRVVAGAFIFLAGVSLTISYSRRKNKKYLAQRGAKIFLLGLFITAVTLIAVPRAPIYFGILHLIGVSIILAIIFLKFDRLVLLAAAVFVMLGNYAATVAVTTPYLAWLGLVPENFYTLDYFPLLPWFGVFLFGLYTGKLLYKNGKRIYKIREVKPNLLCKLGRHSLVIYILHQPVLLTILFLLGYRIF